MRRLILLRHTKADPAGAGISDHARPLNVRGIAAADRIGAYMARHHLMPDGVVCSTAQRTRETWARVAQQFGDPPAATFERRVYDASTERLLATLRDVRDEAHAVLVVGHNPGLHQLATTLIATGDVEDRERLREKLPTGGLVVIDFAVDAWKDVHPRGGRLDRFVTPRSLEDDTA
ncbi:histidine phosphatase family protein [Rhodoplanes sp. TEM]|uniref:Histidine phosphatase family protein n=1 Tax=Rhodoplanes tepidamans TaxID=200616 RepID=A0ABT5JCH4_RHOTP|nr:MULTISPECIES: histidine phosphatase family protein [Rhodoplanes]MDC7786755.1 histidine phosphatase family protein [Rhodoplanes tepidamans]MDC7983761.1 histidine phosphatase family protein [Rhodoplanes sp. TEM]MDQ0358192.1 phosphohistidine phosphatase [Rhodoplanes tepidamans]